MTTFRTYYEQTLYTRSINGVVFVFNNRIEHTTLIGLRMPCRFSCDTRYLDLGGLLSLPPPDGLPVVLGLPAELFAVIIYILFAPFRHLQMALVIEVSSDN